MAWISVYEQLRDHHKLRDLSKQLNCSRHEAMGILVSLWLWGINNADQSGRLNSADAQDIADGIMYHAQCGAQLVNCLVNSGWLHENGVQYIIHDWDVWQAQWYKAVEKREANAKRMRGNRSKDLECATHSAAHSSPHVQASPSPNRHLTVTKSKRNNKSLTAYGHASATTDILPQGFDQFWDMYPRKVKKQDAIKAWTQVKASGSIEVIITMLGVFVDSPEWRKDNGQYIPHPASWLRGRRWEDEITPADDNSFLSIARREALSGG